MLSVLRKSCTFRISNAICYRSCIWCETVASLSTLRATACRLHKTALFCSLLRSTTAALRISMAWFVLRFLSRFSILRAFLLRFFLLFRVFELSFCSLLFFVVDIRVVVGFVVGWCFFKPIAFFLDEVRAGLGIARVVEELFVFRKPTASVTTGVTRCLWRNGVGRATGDGVGGLVNSTGRTTVPDP